jgi:hypothetical protein
MEIRWLRGPVAADTILTALGGSVSSLIPGVDLGLMPGVDMGLIPGVDMGLIPGVDMGLMPCVYHTLRCETAMSLVPCATLLLPWCRV